MTQAYDTGLSALRTAQGSFSMVAIDQRESLRGMMPRSSDGDFAHDGLLVAFKQAVVRHLSEHASGLLIDRPLGLRDGRPAGLADTCGLIVAADVLHQEPGELLTHSTLDPLVTPALLQEVGAVAIKFLILWAADIPAGVRRAVLDPFVELSREANVLSLIEGIVRPPAGAGWRSATERHDAILAAAAELVDFEPDIYKAEVPGYVPGDVSQVAAHSQALTSLVPGPWVVLSNGVNPVEFPDALGEAMSGGASGFLAGRAVWQEVAGTADFERGLAERSPSVLGRLREIADTAVSERDGRAKALR